MNTQSVFRKTAKGSAEVAQRSGQLSLTARRVLIMVDGRRTVAELAPATRPGELEPVLEQLAQAGFVEPLDAPAPPSRSVSAPPTTAGPVTEMRGAPTLRAPTRPPPAGRPPAELPLDDAKRRAVRALRDRIGPAADDLAVEIERCRNAAEFAVLLAQAERMIAAFGGNAAAAEFMRALRPH